MSDTITLTGLVATVPNHIVTGAGLSITNFRLASTQRRYDRRDQKWVDGETNWYTVTTFRQLANNVVSSVQKGQRVVVTGRLRIRDWSTEEKKGTSIEVDAEAVGHDLSWGTAQFTRSTATAVADAESEADTTEGSETTVDSPASDVLATDSFGEPGDHPPAVAPEQEAAALSTPF